MPKKTTKKTSSSATKEKDVKKVKRGSVKTAEEEIKDNEEREFNPKIADEEEEEVDADKLSPDALEEILDEEEVFVADVEDDAGDWE